MKLPRGLLLILAFSLSRTVFADFDEILDQQLEKAFQTVSACTRNSGSPEPEDQWEFRQITVSLNPYMSFGISGAVSLQVGPEFDLIWEKVETESEESPLK